MIINFINGGGDPEAEAQLSARTAELTGVIDRTISGITIPSGVTTIGENAFASCSALTEVTIPSSVTNIEAGAFGENRSLESISFEGTTPPTVEEGAFSQLPTGVTVNVPEGSEDAYSAVTENIDESKAKIVYFTDINDNVTTWYSKYPELDYDTPDNVMPTSQYGAWKKVETQGIKSLDANCFINTLSTEYVLGEECDFSYCTPFRYGDVEKVIFKCPTLRSDFDGRLAETAPNLSSITFYCPEAPLLNTTGTPITTADTAAVGELIIPEGAHNYGIYKERMCGEDWTIKNLSGQTMGTITVTKTGDTVEDYSYTTPPNGKWQNNSAIASAHFDKNMSTTSQSIMWGCSKLTAITFDYVDPVTENGCLLTNMSLGGNTRKALRSITYKGRWNYTGSPFSGWQSGTSGVFYIQQKYEGDFLNWYNHSSTFSGWTIDYLPEPTHNLKIDVDDGQGGMETESVVYDN